MTQPTKQPDAKVDDPLVISTVTFQSPVPIGGHSYDDWSVTGISQNQYHGRSRVESFAAGVKFVFKTDKHYAEIEVPWSNIKSVVRVPLSQLEEQVRAMYERLQKELRR